jgi:uncharacterized glyoxalase superfamily protein PhnB
VTRSQPFMLPAWAALCASRLTDPADCETQPEMERLFAALSENGNVTMPLHDAFWGGRFGMLTDQFGISWMFSFRAPGQ